ncbi:MAG: hypothetical protein FJ118_02045 [Deltaproteobacteria bacterium]|nr:hypothetical protein [Deltaproteobacteria bacterium]
MQFLRALGYVFVSGALLVVVCLLAAVPAQAQPCFDIRKDGFSISNEPGYCFAITAFARWYYLTNQDRPALRTALNKGAQLSIAKELQSYYSKNLIRVQAEYCNRNSSDPSESFRRFVTGLLMGEPRIVLLMTRNQQRVVLHAVLAYDWIPGQNLLKIYDPNYNSQEKILDLEEGRYTSLDITYDAICFPEVLDNNPALIQKMQALYRQHVGQEKRHATGPVTLPTTR